MTITIIIIIGAASALLAGFMIYSALINPDIGQDWRVCDHCSHWSNEFGAIYQATPGDPPGWDGVNRGERRCEDCQSAHSIQQYLDEKKAKKENL